jgi:hypothetical protein
MEPNSGCLTRRWTRPLKNAAAQRQTVRAPNLIMAKSHCPICYGDLEVREVAPCFDCGHDPTEFEHLDAQRHKYSEVLAFGIPIVLCGFCQADFSSYDPEYFNRPKGTVLGLREFTFVRELREPRPAKDKFCRTCNRRLAFLRFVSDVRDRPRVPGAP